MKCCDLFKLSSLVMKNRMTAAKKFRFMDGALRLNPLGFLLALALIVPLKSGAADDEMGEAFATPQAAVSALTLALNSRNGTQLREIFGPGAEDLQNPDQVQATNEMEAFADALQTTNELVRESGTKYALNVGSDAWPFPVPIVQKGGQWYFDTADGKEELLNRRIGRNELDVLKVVRAYVDAQREYAAKDRNGDEVLEYAQKLSSSPGKKDGLYWPSDLDGEMSPLGPLVADAQAEGYNPKVNGQETTHSPFHGYYFKILTSQSKHAPGGKYSYIINGHMIGGFALVAWPADYGNTGVMTFIVNQQGRVYQRDLGKNTFQTAAAMTEYDPATGWTRSRD
jgi:Protein of unknown function (DUF2950)